MALSADDRLLGEKTHYYCSSSEDEGEDDKEEGRSDDTRVRSGNSSRPQFIPDAEVQGTNEKGPALNVSMYTYCAATACHRSLLLVHLT